MSAEIITEPIGPEASLRYTVEEIVRYFGEPTKMNISAPKIILGDDGGLFQEAEVSKDSSSGKECGHMSAQILAQEIAEVDIDQGLPYYIVLRAKHKLGDIFVHVTLPDFNHPILVPSDGQKSRPTISTTVDGKERTTFDKNFMLNELLGELGEALVLASDNVTQTKIRREIYLLNKMFEMVRPVKCRDGASQDMTETQERLLEDYLSTLFWPGSENGINQVERRKITFRTMYESMVAVFVDIKFGKL